MFFRFEETKERVEERRQWQDELKKAREASDDRLNKALEEWRADHEYERTQREQERARQEQERIRQEQERQRQEQERQQFINLAEQNQQLLAGLMAQNLELNNRLLSLLERRNGPANGNGASENPDAC